MVPEVTRRRALAALAAVGSTAVAGCTTGSGSEAEPTTASTTATPTTDEPEPTTESEAEQPGDPIDPVVAILDADDADAFQSQFHPLHPFHPDNLDEDGAEGLVESDTYPENVTASVVDQPVTAELVLATTYPGSNADRPAVEDALADAETAVVELSVSDADATAEDVRFVTVTRDGEWVILAQGVPTSAELAAADLDARVVAGVTFDGDAARVEFLDDVVADRVAVEASSSGASASTGDTSSVTFLEVDLDPDGDEVVVSATVDGDEVVVHREQYPPDERLVDSVEFDDDPEGARDAAARVHFTDVEDDGEVHVEATVSGGESSAEPAGVLDYLVVGVDPDGDQVVVSHTAADAGEPSEIHRVRYHP